jgi:uncharacterized protein YjbJ (UPF0337 family)
LNVSAVKAKRLASKPDHPCVERRHATFIGESTMSGTSDKIKGMANEVVGNVKQGVGKVTGNESLQVKGKIQEKKGEAQQVVGDVKDAVDKR